MSLSAQSKQMSTKARKRAENRNTRRQAKRELASVDPKQISDDAVAERYEIEAALVDEIFGYDFDDLYALDGLDYKTELGKELDGVLGGYDPIREQPIESMTRFGELIDHYVDRLGPLNKARQALYTERFFIVQELERSMRPTFGSMMQLVNA